MQGLFAEVAEPQRTGPQVVNTITVADGVTEEVLAGCVSRETAAIAENYPVSKFGGVKGTMFYWFEHGKRGEDKQKLRLVHCSKDPRRRSEGQHYNDTTFRRVLVLVRIKGGEKDGHIELRQPRGKDTAADIRRFAENYGAALDDYQMRHLESEAARAELDEVNGSYFYFHNA